MNVNSQCGLIFVDYFVHHKFMCPVIIIFFWVQTRHCFLVRKIKHLQNCNVRFGETLQVVSAQKASRNRTTYRSYGRIGMTSSAKRLPPCAVCTVGFIAYGKEKQQMNGTPTMNARGELC